MDYTHVSLEVVLVTLGDPTRLTGGYLYHQRLAELAPSHGARLRFASIPDRPFPLAILDGPPLLRRIAHLQPRPHALVLDSIAAAFLGPWFALRAPRVPLLGMLHQPPGGIDHGPRRARVQATLDRLSYRRASLLMLASEHLAEQMVADGFHPGRLVVVPPGRDVASAVGSPPANPRQGRQAAFLCVGNWVARKGILDLLEAFARVPEHLATLHLAGDDQTEPAYAARVHARLAQPDLANRVVVHGPISREGVAALYSAVDAFVLPSLKEPYGTVYGEAMAMGLPVVGWRAGNLPYLATHEAEGVLLEPGDLPGLTGALTRLARDAALRQRLGAAARVRAQSRPTWRETAALFFGTIRTLRRLEPDSEWPELDSADRRW